MKKVIGLPCIIYILLLGLYLSSCNDTRTHYVIGVSQCSDDEWRNKMNTEMRHEAALQQGIELIINTVEDDTEQQIKDIENFISQGVDLIIVAPNKAAPITPVIEKAHSMGIPVILVDRKILSDKFTAFIGADNFQIGKEVGYYAADLLKGKGNIVEIRGLEGSSPALERHQGFYSVIHDYPDIKIVYDGDGAWLKEVAGNRMNEALDTNTDIDLVFAHNDRMAIGAYNAAGLQNRADKISFLGIDALPGEGGGIEEVIDQRLKATFIYPTGGDKIIQLALAILEGRPFEKNTQLNTAVIDSTNVIVFKLQADEILTQESKIRTLNEKVGVYLSQYTTQRYLIVSTLSVIILFVIFLIFLMRAYRTKIRLNSELKKRNTEIESQKNLLEEQRDQLIQLSRQLEEATHAKLVFFTNISHEFRTPLTLISGPISTLLANNPGNDQYRLLKLAERNVQVLMKLIDQVIDFRKYENGKLELNPGMYDLKKEIEEWNASFSEICRKKGFHFFFETDTDTDFTIRIDREKIERIYFNLLSNAVKFTNDKGNIIVSLKRVSREESDYACMEVSNTGKGISEKDIQHIFDRFYQVESHMAGSGIGLALAKALTELHSGKIEVESRKDGLTVFSVWIPFIRTAYDSPAEKLPSLSKHEIREIENDAIAKQSEVFEEQAEENKMSLLVVDDNPDILDYIKAVLNDQYRILLASDGEEGLQKAIKQVPDLIISDVMMPKMDGIEFCRKVKEELSTSHIPVILLTAWSMDEQRIVGFKSGADDYISKPFNSEVLEARVNNLIENRKRLKERFRQGIFSEKETGTGLPEKDRTFLDKFRHTIEENLSNSELNVEEIGQSLGLSRTQLYRKIKSLTNYSPVELVKILRLKKAYDLLCTSERSISEVSYETGFTSPSYFTKCFREYFNESPTELIKRCRK